MSRVVRAVVGVVAIAVSFIPGAQAYAPYLLAFGLSLVVGAVLEAKPSTLENLRSQTVVLRSAIKPQDILFGRDKKSGVLAYFGTSGTNNKYLWFVIAVAEHEIDGYETLWLDHVGIDIATEIDVDGFVTKSDFIDADGNKLVKTKFYTGTTDQTADAELVAAFTDWTTDHRGREVAYFWVRVELDLSEGGNDPENPSANVWPKGYPRDIAVTARGAKVYDPREVGHNVANPATWEWSDNPILCRAFYLMSSRLGPGYLSSEIDWTVVEAQANICDALVSIPGSETQKRYTLNGVVTVDRTPKEILESMQTADFGTTLFLPDGIQILAGAWAASSHTIDETWIAGQVSCESASPADNAYNAVRGQYVSAADEYTIKEFQPRLAPAYETEDAVGRVWSDIVLPFTRDEFEAQRIAIIELKKSRQQKTVNLTTNFRGELVEPFQIVTLNFLNFDSDTFRVISRATSDDGTTVINLREEVASDWTYTIPDLAVPPVVPSISRSPSGVPSPTALAAITAAEGIRVAWAHPSLTSISYIELYGSATNDRSTATLLHKGLTEQYFHALAEDTVRYYWVAARGTNGMLSAFFPASPTAGIEGTAGGASIGANAISGQLTNERHTVAANADGTGYDLSESGGTFGVWDGVADVTGIGPAYSVVAPATVDGLTMAINATTGVYSLSGTWTGTQAGFMLRAVYSGVTIDKWYGIVKSLGGTGAKLLKIFASNHVFKYNTSGTLVGANEIVFTAEQTGSSATVYWVTQYWNGTAWVSTTSSYMSSGTGLTSTLTEALFQSAITTEGGGGHDTLLVHALFSDPDTVDYYYDYITITKVQDGAAGANGLPGADGADGSDGINARAISLSAVNAFTYNQAGLVPSPASVVVTATAVNAEGSLYYRYLKNDVEVKHSLTDFYIYTPQANISSMPDKIEVELREGGAGNPVLARDQLTMFGLRQGSDAVTVILSNEAHTLPTTAAGTVTYTGSGTTVRVFEGATALTYVTSSPGNGQWTFTSVTPSNITAGAISGSGTTTATLANHSAMTSDNATITFTINGTRASVGNIAFSDLVKIQSLAKSTEGAAGTAGRSSALTNPLALVAASETGLGYSLATAYGTHEVWDGATNVTSGGTTHIVVGGSGTPSSLTQNGLTCQIATNGTYSTSGASWTTDSETFTLRATYSGSTFNKVFTVTKVKGAFLGGPRWKGPTTVSAVKSSGTAMAGFRLTNAGIGEKRINDDASWSSFSPSHAWLVGSTAYGDFSVRATTADPALITTGTLDTWQVLSSTRAWTVESTSGRKIATLQLEIRRDSTGEVEQTISMTLDAFLDVT